MKIIKNNLESTGKTGNEYDYLMVGAGPFGAVFLREMADAGKKCLVIDRGDHIAGNIYDENIVTS